MSRKTATLYRDDIVREYVAGKTINQIMSQFDISRTSAHRQLAAAGVDTSRRLVTVDVDRARSLYDSGIGVAGVAQKLGVSRPALLRIFRDARIKTRNRSEQQYARAARMTPEERKALAKPSHDAKRGTKRSLAERIKAAKSRQARKTHTSPTEDELATMFANRGIDTVPQQAIGPYNCDLATFPVAVEVWGGHWHWYGAHILKTEERFRYIMNAGWHILVVPVNASSPLTPAVADYLVTEIKRLRANPSAVRQYRVVWRTGEFATGGCANDDNFSVEPPFTRGIDPATGNYMTVPR